MACSTPKSTKSSQSAAQRRLAELAAQGNSDVEAACPALPNWRSAMVVDRNRKAVLSQRTAMLDVPESRTIRMSRQRTAVIGELWASRTAMMLPHVLGSEHSQTP